MTTRLPRALAALVTVAAAGLIGWRVLAPAEVLEEATDPYPAAVTLPAGVTGKTTLAPLIVDERIRVYAGERLVKADAPVDAKTTYTPRWSFRRWPEQVTGLVAVGTTVVSRWSDGELVALDGRTGKIAWRTAGPAATGFEGRTGSAAVWAPPGLHTAGTNVLVSDGRRTIAHAITDGAERWSVECGDGFTTAGGQYVCGVGAWDAESGAPLPGWPAGSSTALFCGVARSGCTGMRDASGQNWQVGGAQPVLGGTVLNSAGGFVIATRAGREMWRWAGDAQILGVRADKVVLLAADQQLVTLDAATGRQLVMFPLFVKNERVAPWKPASWQLTDRYVAVERLRTTGGPDPYFTMDPVVIATF